LLDREMVFRAVGHPSPVAGLVEPAAAAVWQRWLRVPCAIAAAPTGFLAHRTLGLSRTPDLRTKMGHRLVAEGVYARARHPMYTSFFELLAACFPLRANRLTDAWGMGYSLLIIGRAAHHEWMMLERFGDEYRAYMQQTGRFQAHLWAARSTGSMKQSALVHERVFAGDSTEAYAQKHREIAEKFGREMAGKLALRSLEGIRILDAGCGLGATAIVHAQALPGSEVVGIDLSGPLLGLAIQVAQATGLAWRVAFGKADVQEIPYDDDSFDAALNLQMRHIVQDPVAMLDEMERVLAPEGVQFIADIRRSWVGPLGKVFMSALTVEKAQ
jgi:protein-S-isoprenylcysteine O-methyltransferase Ste14/predicted O-methyltransferase YrrM